MIKNVITMPIHYSAPGKLFISGEWSVLELGNRGLVAAVNNRVHVEVDELAGYDGISVTAPDFSIQDARAKIIEGKLRFLNLDEESQKKMGLLAGAIETAVRFAMEKGHEFRSFKISTSSKETQLEVNGEMKKIGFGSSAALVVSTINAVLDFLGCAPTKEESYKLAAIAHYFAQGKIGSAFDVAASTYGGLFVYSRFDPSWLTEKVEGGEKLSDIISAEWSGFSVETLNVPDDFRLLVAWTKDSASTSAMVKQMKGFKESQREEYDRLYNTIAATAGEAIEAFKKNNRDAFFAALKKNQLLLKELGEKSRVNIVTPELEALAAAADKYTAGKLSGAGGGDCGIAICFDEETAGNIVSDWRTVGLHPLDVTIDRDGVRKE